jgi:D-aminoacyl-tRNA deacylase
MRVVAQRVASAEVEVAGEIVGRIGRGLLVYVGAAKGDTEAELDYVAEKIAGLRVFEDEQGKMSRSVQDVGGAVLVVSQFTLLGDVRKGRRPSFDSAAAPEEALARYEGFIERLRARALAVRTGRFRAPMNVRCDVDGPVTILIDSTKSF